MMYTAMCQAVYQSGEIKNMAIHRLNWSKVKGWTQDGKPINRKKHMHCDGNGLYLATKGGNSESWIRRYNLHGRKQQIGLGPFRLVTLEQARKKAVEIGIQVLEGKNPKAERDGVRIDQEIKAGRNKTVSQVWEEYFAAKYTHKSPGTIKLVQWQFPKYVLAKIGERPIEKVTTNIIIDDSGVGLLKLWTEKHKTAQQVRSLLDRMFSFAIHRGDRTGDNPARLKGHLEHLLPASADVHTVRNCASLPYQDIGRFMATLWAYDDKSKSGHKQGRTVMALMIEFIVLTGVRLNEALAATWGQFDFERGIWTVPTGRDGNVKRKDEREMQRELPITPQMLDVLRQIQEKGIDMSPDAPVFPSPRGGQYHQNAPSEFIRDTLKWKEPKIDLHGFRRTFTTWALAPGRGFTQREVDGQLDHKVPGQVRQAYDHGASAEERRPMMTAWGEYCTRPSAGPYIWVKIGPRRRSGRSGKKARKNRHLFPTKWARVLPFPLFR
jgi:integrase